MHITPHQAKYFATEILCQSDLGVERISQGLFNAKVDLNPHQIDAALFALKNPLNRGVLLADEVGLGKTVEAGLVLCQLWAERKRKLLVICPAILRKQWANELADKFGLPCVILEKSLLKREYGDNLPDFLRENLGKRIVVISYQYATKLADNFAGELWDCVVIDEAHKLRNAHRQSNKMGQALKIAFNERKKLLLTATPLQNSLMELYGLSTLLDEHLFGDEKVFRRKFVSQSNNLGDLKDRLKTVVKRTLRADVLEYIRYTKRHTITQNFYPSDEEQTLYQAISDFIGKEESIALPKRQRHLIGLILRKLLASSPYAVADTLSIILKRLYALKEQQAEADLLAELKHVESDFDGELSEDLAEDDGEAQAELAFNHALLNDEIAQIEGFLAQTNRLKNDSKATALLTALQTGFEKMTTFGAAQKAIIFTESVRTQAYLYDFLCANGYQDKIVSFSGSNNHEHARQIYANWLADKNNESKITGSAQVDKRTALIDYFKDEAQIMLATEAASEGVNLQFCSLLINYDLPWNPQRVEQRIGRCHRYGQQFDVVVVNFLNQRNEADQRVLELLSEKFQLFDGVFGASDEILGRIETGLDFEKRIAHIYDSCRTSSEIKQAFDQLQQEMDDEIKAAMAQAKSQLLDNFDEDVHERLKGHLLESQKLLDKTSRYFWAASRFALKNYADFDEQQKAFYLRQSPIRGVECGRYCLQKKDEQTGLDYRLNHALGEWCLTQCVQTDTPVASLQFDYSNHLTKLSVLANKQGKSGWLWLDKLGFYGENQTQEMLVFTAKTDDGEWLDDDFCRKLLSVAAVENGLNQKLPEDLKANAEQAIKGKMGEHSEIQTALLKAESERLDKWAEDKKKAVQEEIKEMKQKIQEAIRDRRNATNLEQLAECEKNVRDLERKQSLLRKNIDQVEDDIEKQRDENIDKIFAQLKQNSRVEHLFRVRWEII
ncbi:SNF2-related protein [Necropsobacter massiliensis]|uniref:SNF2-related protein n=1 Tax=Necropsobacter massiliensis TaxID=1400001 RepID=UPI000595F558|nr:SNF2-related protein [Necropsobacter massiliensis]